MEGTYSVFNTITDGNKFYIKNENGIKEISIVGICIENSCGKDIMYLLTSESVRNDTTCKYTVDEILAFHQDGTIYFDKDLIEK